VITGPHSPGVVVALVVVDALVVGAGVAGALGLVVDEDEPVPLLLVAQSAGMAVVVPLSVVAPIGGVVVVVTVSVAVTTGVVAPLGLALLVLGLDVLELDVLELDVLELDVVGLDVVGLAPAPVVELAGRFG
jgi:hypothetical protein